MKPTPILGALALALLLPALATPAAAQSFDCARASQPDEFAICDSGRLAALDVEMSALYRDIQENALMGMRGAVQDEQRQFLRERAGCRYNKHCIARLYHQRIAELRRDRASLGPN